MTNEEYVFVPMLKRWNASSAQIATSARVTMCEDEPSRESAVASAASSVANSGAAGYRHSNEAFVVFEGFEE
jgi:hypothetical protein